MSIYRIVQYCKRGRSLFPSSSTAFASSSPRFLSSSAVRVGYLTDLEGDYQHWRKYCETSEIFDASPKGFALKEGCHFVFGGDLCDRNSGDLRLLTDFAALKRRYPDRVHFILGNRDINKLRLLFSLQQSILVDLHPPLVYWLQGLPAHIAQASKEVISGDPSTKLKWILSRTMGAPLAFQHRREELRELGMPAEDADVTRSFLESLTPRVGLLWEILSQGKIALIMGDTLFVHGAIHEYNMGWIPPMKADYSSTPNQISLNPPHLVPEKRLTSIRQWEQEINAFARNELLDYTNHAETYLTQGRAQGDISVSPSQFLWEVNGGYQHPQPGSRLIQYGMGGLPARQLNNTVIYSSYLQAGRAKYSSELASHWLSEQGIARVIVGHQPHGDAPWILNAHSVQTISADSAYSKNVLWPATHFEQAVPSSQGGEGELEYVTYLDYLARTKDPRYPAAMTYAEKESTRSPFAHSEVLLTFHEGLDADKASSEVKISGTLSDTSSFSFSLKKGAGDSSFIGLKTKDDWFVKAENVVPSGGRRGEGGGEGGAGRRFYLLAKSGDGFKFMNRIVEEQDLIRELYTP